MKNAAIFFFEYSVAHFMHSSILCQKKISVARNIRKMIGVVLRRATHTFYSSSASHEHFCSRTQKKTKTKTKM